MDTRSIGLTALLVLLPLTRANAAPIEAPRDFLANAAQLQQAFVAEIARPVYVVEVNFGPHYAEMLVQDKADPEVYDKYSVTPGDRISRPKPVKVGEVSCRKVRVAMEQLRLDAAATALADAQALAAANGFSKPEVIAYGADVFCKNAGWRVLMTPPDNNNDMLELVYGLDGGAPRAQRLAEYGWKKVDLKSLRSGQVAARAPAPDTKPPDTKGDGRKRDFRADPLAAVAIMEKALGSPPRLLDIGIDTERVNFKLIDPANKKRQLTYFVNADGSVSQWHAEDAIPFDCNKPFAASEVPIARVPEFIDIALGAIPPMRDAAVHSVRIYRSGLCGVPHVYITLEDERATGEVEFDAKGKLLSAQVR